MWKPTSRQKGIVLLLSNFQGLKKWQVGFFKLNADLSLLLLNPLLNETPEIIFTFSLQ